MEQLTIFQEKLFSLSDKEYQAFQSKFVNNIDSNSIIGVRVPKIRGLAKEIWNSAKKSDSEKESVKAGIKKGLEDLKGKIPGLVDIKVNTNGRLPSSTADLMLDSTFESEEALKGYSKHPEHVAVADSKVRPFTASRACLDFEI